jgi:hypothetical protein
MCVCREPARGERLYTGDGREPTKGLLEELMRITGYKEQMGHGFV